MQSEQRTAYETCPDCKGYVMHFNMAGEINDGCRYCKDSGVVRVRDNRGRFSCREISHATE